MPPAPEIEQMPSNSLAADAAEQTTQPPAQSSPSLEGASQSLPGRHAEENPPRPTLLSFYGFWEQPFGITPDPAYLYLGQEHREALGSLLGGIQNDRGFMALIAEPGMGKTTLLNRLMEELRGSVRTVSLFQTQCSSREFFRYLLSELGIANAGMDVVAMHNKLNEVLFQEMVEGRRFVLIVDEAQNLQNSVLETIRLLSNFETPHGKLLQIVLAGQPELAAKLSHPSLSQLRQRIATLNTLQPLSAAETVHYIEHRLRVVSTSGGVPFSPDALALIAERSEGIPRNINNICFNALMLGYSRESKTIGAAMVQEVAAKLNLESLVRRSRKPKAILEPAPVVADNLPEPAGDGSTVLPSQGQAGQSSGKAKSTSRIRLNGKLTELIGNGRWGKEREFRLQASLERESSSGISVGDRYYCCSFYVGEEEAKAFRAGQSIRITIEQD